MSCAQQPSGLPVADSLYFSKNWKAAKPLYATYLGDTSRNGMIWNRLGYCNQNLGMYADAIADFNKSISCNPAPAIKGSAMSRLAMIYAMTNKTSESVDWLLKATGTGYNSLNDLDSLDEFRNLRTASNFNEIRKKIYEVVYPCSKNPRNHDFDFWIGDWYCYRTGTQILSGISHVESMAGGCALLENYTASQAYSGKSFNFYDTVAGKWQQDWIGSGGPGDRQHYYNGEYKNGAMHFTYETTTPQGEKVRGTFIFYFVGQDTVRQYQDVVDENGKTTTVIYDLIYIRKKK